MTPSQAAAASRTLPAPLSGRVRALRILSALVLAAAYAAAFLVSLTIPPGG